MAIGASHGKDGFKGIATGEISKIEEENAPTRSMHFHFLSIAMYHGTAVSPTLANWTDNSPCNLLHPIDFAPYAELKEPAILPFVLFDVLIAGIPLSLARQVPSVEL